MKQKIAQLHILLKFGLGLTLVVAGLIGSLVMTQSQPAAQAQAVLTQTNIQTSAITSNSATITWKTNINADRTVNYGLTGAYGLSESLPCNFAAPGTCLDHAIIVGSLVPGTVYHYQVVSTDASGNTKESRDRTFATSSSSTGDSTPPSVFGISVDSINTSATVTFTTSEGADVVVNYGQTTGYGSSESVLGLFNTNHNIFLSSLSALTTYHYQIIATDTSGNALTTGDFNFTTSGSATDHTFTTGACTDGTDIGQCNVLGQYCDGGTLVNNCTQCGYSCDINQTCRVGGICVQDPPTSGSAFDCNPDTCYNNGIFTTPSAAGCYASWGRCNANIVLKVRPDRVCDKWLTCQTSTTVLDRDSGREQQLCYDLTGCNEIGPDGRCASFLAERQCNNDPLTLCNNDSDCPAGGSCNIAAYYCDETPGKSCLSDDDCPGDTNDCIGGIKNITFSTPEDIDRIKNLSGAVVAGLDWTQQPDSVIEGYYPWNVMPQLGGRIDLTNNGFEERGNEFRCKNNISIACNKTNIGSHCESDPDQCVLTTNIYAIDPWSAWSPTNKFNETDVSLINEWDNNNDAGSGNRVLRIQPIAEEYSGAITSLGSTPSVNEFFFVTLRAKSSLGGTRAVVQFDPQNKPAIPESVIELETSWQTFTVGPARGIGPGSLLKVVCYNDGNDCDTAATIIIDDVSIKPVLEIQTGTKNVRVPPSCRMYPRGDSQICEYTSDNGVNFRGWYGFCLEEWPANSGNCISWWPVDLIKGEGDLFGTGQTAGYQGRVPLYYCFESQGRTPIADLQPDELLCLNDANPQPCSDGSENVIDARDYTFGVCNNNEACETAQNGTSKKTLLTVRSGGPGASDWAYYAFPAGDTRRHLYEYEIAFAKAELVYRSASEGEGYPGSFTFVSSLMKDNYRKVVDLQTKFNYVIQRRLDEKGQRILWYLRPEPAWTSGNNYLWFALEFECLDIGGNVKTCDINNDVGRLTGMGVLGFDLTGLESEPALYDLTIEKHDICTQVVKVADSTKNKAWANRISENSNYVVRDDFNSPSSTNLNYGYGQDFSPFGGVANPNNSLSPQAWTQPLYAERPNDVDKFPPGQARSGSPYACEGDCSERRCLGGPNDGDPCRNSATDCSDDQSSGVCVGVGICSTSLTDCTSDNVCGGGICIGGAASGRGDQTLTSQSEGVSSTNNAHFAERNLIRLWAQSYGWWEWDFNKQTYNNLDPFLIGQWLRPNNLCPTDADGKYVRPPAIVNWPAEYCSIPSTIGEFFIGKNQAKTVVLNGGSGTVDLRYTTNIDPEQVPLLETRFDFDGDGEIDRTDPGHGAAPKSSVSDPHNITTIYRCFTGLPSCSTDSPPCYDDSEQACIYEPKIQIQDNWEVCNNTTSTICPTDTSNWYPVAPEDKVTVKVKLEL